ncbi:hypothetical protein GCM10007079_05360 [Nocardiopsis terrae]|uniref:Uncharacterized protein n=2 Tax=Nocardiopsis terrae TaxID=372655 RepID=A0ABR9HNH7_9ACTN|nr:hypothetical protein [Nocardiopsis terrae]MBE1460587.1 hypothetical protein [Nocardiopsis terrae]GHC72264.1 hypothetical protein GCM10007079_05360 [Nocardiopsis terrae]
MAFPSFTDDPIFWAAVGSLATAGALLVSIVLLMFQFRDRTKAKKQEKRFSAEHVSGWINVNYEPKIIKKGKEDLEGLKKKVKVSLKNTGNQPVFDVSMRVAEKFPGSDYVKLGNLGLPTTIPVLPPEDGGEWDISDQLAHYDVLTHMYLEVTFRDSADRYWKRDFSGKLKEINPKKKKYQKANESEMHRQLGHPSPENPFAIAIAFYTLITSESPSDWQEALNYTTPESEWGDPEKSHNLLTELGMTTYLEYPTKGVAYVRFVAPQKDNVVVKADHMGPLVDARIMTLQYREEFESWKVHSIGLPCPPEHLPPRKK